MKQSYPSTVPWLERKIYMLSILNDLLFVTAVDLLAIFGMDFRFCVTESLSLNTNLESVVSYDYSMV